MIDRSNFSLMTLSRWLLDFLLSQAEFQPLCSLALGRTMDVNRPGLAIDAIVMVLFPWHFCWVVVAFDVLPGFASFAKNGIAIVILEVANALDGIFLLFFDGCAVGESWNRL